MPIALTLIGLVLVISGVRNTYADLGKTLAGEFTGSGNYTYRAAAIVMLGVIGYAGDDARKLSVGLMVLMTLGLLLSVDKDFFGKLGMEVSAAPVKPAVVPASAPGGASSASSSSSSAIDTGIKAVKLGATLLAL